MSTLVRPPSGEHPRRDAEPPRHGRPAPPPAAAQLLAKVRREWVVALLLRALATGMGAAALVAAGLLVLDLLLDLPLPVRRVGGWLPLAAGLAPVAVAAARLVRAPDDERLALLAQERLPGLRNAMATAVSARPTGRVGRLFEDRLEAVIGDALRDAGGRVVRPRLRRPLLALAGGAGLLVVLALLGGGPTALLESWRRPAHEAPHAVAPGSPLGRAGAGGPADAVRLGALRWVATAPSYAGGGTTDPSGDEPIQALAGSGIVVRFALAGPGAEWSARLIGGGDSDGRDGQADLRLEGGRLLAAFTMLPELRGLEVEARGEGGVVARRVVPVAPVPDEPPSVTLGAPARDEVLGTADVLLPVRARAGDDHGVGALRLGWIRSRGSGESFGFEEGELEFETVSRGDGPGSGAGVLTGESRLDLAALGLGPGDVLHLRAIASDRNDVTGPGVGVSATRVIRIAGVGEEHEVTALIGPPPDVEERPVLSQRMIILMTERLRDSAPRMGRAEVTAEAMRIAREQGRLRARVGEILFVRSTGGIDTPEELAHDPFGGDYAPHGHADHEHVEGDEDWDPTDPEAVLEAASRATGQGTLEELQHVHDDAPVVAVNRDLLEAYNEMFEAERALRQAAVDAALPPEYRALDILQRVREGERVFARGQVTVAPIDVSGTRGTGELTRVAVTDRSTADPGDVVSAAASLDEAVAALELPADRAALAISAVAARLLAAGAMDPRTAAILSRAAEAAGDGRRDDAAARLAEARARLEPSSSPAGAGGGVPRAREAVGRAYHRLLATGVGASPTARSEAAPSDAVPSAARPFVFATARYASGDWDSAPLVPSNLIHSLASYTAIPVEPEGVVVDLASNAVFDHPLLFLTGHLPVRFTEAESRNVRAFVERGGLLFVDDHNHDIDGAFHRTATAELRRIFGEDALRPLPNEHELYTAFFRFDDGPPITGHELSGWGDGLIHEHLQAIMVDGRIGVLYSNKDYASEWNYHAVNKRFLALDNTRFGVNILVYALTR